MLLHLSRLGCIVTLLLASSISAQTTPPATITTSTDGSSFTPPPTCRSGSVNYITQSLPQQCAAFNHTASRSESTAIGGTDQISSIAEQITSQSPSEPAASQAAATDFVEVEPSDGKTLTAEEHEAEDPDRDSDNEQDSPLDNANFLSFEEWKKQNLENVGQSPENVGQGVTDEGRLRARPDLTDALDVLGEDSEIELDFLGFGGAASPQQFTHQSRGPAERARQTVVADKPTSQHTHRNKDAGKTCKERTNYASFDCAATVVKTNPECKSASSVLVENKDSYMLNICKVENKFFIIELCDSILIDTVVLANYEFFSSIFRTFRLSVSDRYPVKPDKWRDLGLYDARNTRDVQAFLVEEPLIWARYLRIEILSHYGNEYYCPVSLLRVHGTTMMEEFRHQEEVSRGDYSESDEETIEAENPIVVAPIKQESAINSIEADKSATVVEQMPLETEAVVSSAEIISNETSNSASSSQTQTETTEVNPQNASPTAAPVDPSISKYTESNETRADDPLTTSTQTAKHSGPTSTALSNATQPSATARVDNSTITAQEGETAPSAVMSPSDQPDSTNTTIESTTSASDVEETEASTASSEPSSQGESSVDESSKPAASSSTIPEGTKRPSNTATGSPPVPSTQASFFKSIHKRLQTLESNATLSLQYIEEQSRILRDAFSKVEKRQVRKTERFLSELNATVNAELRSFRTEYDQLWQSTVIELETHRRLYQQEILAVSARLNMVAEELLFQKRMAMAQSTLLVLCVGLVLFNRAGMGGPNVLDLPLLQQRINRSPKTAGVSSPSGTKAFWRRSVSPGGFDEDTDGSPGGLPDVVFEPPTPEVDRYESRSGPSTPTGSREVAMGLLEREDLGHDEEEDEMEGDDMEGDDVGTEGEEVYEDGLEDVQEDEMLLEPLQEEDEELGPSPSEERVTEYF